VERGERESEENDGIIHRIRIVPTDKLKRRGEKGSSRKKMGQGIRGK